MAEIDRVVVPEIMIPLVGDRVESSETLKELIDLTAEAVKAETGGAFDYLVGTMIELPRAALLAEGSPKMPSFLASAPTT